MRKLPIALGVLLALGVACSTFGQPTRVGAAQTVAQSFFLTAAGTTSTLSISGQLKCEVQINAPTGTFSAVPQFSTDGFSSSIDTGTWVGNGLIGNNGVYIGTNPGSPSYTSFRLNINAFSGTQISGQLVCGDVLPPANNGSSGGGVSSVTGGVCITTTPSVGDVVVTNACTPQPLAVQTPIALDTTGGTLTLSCPTCATATATPGPPLPLSVLNGGTGTSSPNPIGSNGCTVTGTWPSQTFACPTAGAGGVTAVTGSGNIAVTAGATPNVTITAAPSFANATISSLGTTPCVGANSGLLVPGTSTATSCLVRGSSGSWDTVACGETSVTHCYTLKDASGSSTAADTPTGSAAPSPVPAPTVSPGVEFGAPPISNDGETSMQTGGGTGNGYLQIPLADWPTTGSYSIEVVVAPNIVSGNNTIFSIDSTDNQIFYYQAGNTYKLNSGGTPVSLPEIPASNLPVDLILSCCPSNGQAILYIDGMPIGTGLGASYTSGGLPGSVGFSPSFGSVCLCRFAKFAIYNTALTQTQVWTHVAALNL